MLVGGGIGILAGMLLVNFGGVVQFQFRLVTILIMAIVTALLGAWASSMIGVSTPNSRLKLFDQEMADGHVLMMVDVPKGRIGEVHHLLQETHPEAVNKGSESSFRRSRKPFTRERQDRGKPITGEIRRTEGVSLEQVKDRIVTVKERFTAPDFWHRAGNDDYRGFTGAERGPGGHWASPGRN